MSVVKFLSAGLTEPVRTRSGILMRPTPRASTYDTKQFRVRSSTRRLRSGLTLLY